MSTKEKVSLRETGPFTPAEAARRVKLLSKQFSNFHLCHPHWHTAWLHWTWETEYPLQLKKLSPHFQFKVLHNITGSFKGKADRKLLTAFLKSTSAIPDSDSGVMELNYGSSSSRGDIKLENLWLKCENENLKLEATFQCLAKSTGDQKKDNQSIPDSLSVAKDVARWTSQSVHFKTHLKPDAEGRLPALVSFILDLPQARRTEVESAWDRLASSPPGRPKEMKWLVSFREASCRDNAQFLKRVESVNRAGLPGECCALSMELTFAELAALEDVFNMAIKTDIYEQALARFDTDKGKHTLLLFTVEKKGIKFLPRYGVTGWENVDLAGC